MCLGMLIWLAVFLDSLVVFVYPILFFVLVNTLVIPVEEQRMAETMGASYATYHR